MAVAGPAPPLTRAARGLTGWRSSTQPRHCIATTLHRSDSRQHRESTPKTFSRTLTPPPQRVSDACAELPHITRYSPNQVDIAAPSTRVRNSSNYLGSFGVGPVSCLCRTAPRRIIRAFRPAPPQHPRSRSEHHFHVQRSQTARKYTARLRRCTCTGALTSQLSSDARNMRFHTILSTANQQNHVPTRRAQAQHSFARRLFLAAPWNRRYASALLPTQSRPLIHTLRSRATASAQPCRP
jgi:hypothetical protein